MQYIVSKITTYDAYNQLFETKVGLSNSNMDLAFTVWGKSEETSRTSAITLVNLLNNHH